MVRGGVKAGYAVFAPQHLFSARGFAENFRETTDQRLRLIGTSLTAVEVDKVKRSMDVLLKRPEIEPGRVAMIGLSYGGYYTLVTTALERRIKVAVVSGYFGVQEGRNAVDKLSVRGDFRLADRFTLFRDSDIAAMICPRALSIQAGSRDDYEHLIAQVAAHYAKLGAQGQFRYVVFDGSHEIRRRVRLRVRARSSVLRDRRQRLPGLVC